MKPALPIAKSPLTTSEGQPASPPSPSVASAETLTIAASTSTGPGPGGGRVVVTETRPTSGPESWIVALGQPVDAHEAAHLVAPDALTQQTCPESHFMLPQMTEAGVPPGRHAVNPPD